MEHRRHLPDVHRGERVTRIPIERSPVSEAQRRKRRRLALLSILVAAGVGVSVHAVKFHLEAVFAKLGATSRAEAVAKGLRRGLILL